MLILHILSFYSFLLKPKLFYSYNFFYVDKKNYLNGLFSSANDLFQDEPQALLLNVKDEEVLSKEINLLVCSSKYMNYVIILIFSMENIMNCQSIGLNFLREIQIFLILEKNKCFNENLDEFKKFFNKVGLRIEKYMEKFQMKNEVKSSVSIYFFFKALKLGLENHLPFYQLPETLSHEIRHILYKINEPISEDLKLFSSSKPCLLAIGASFCYKGLLFWSSLENELAYYLNSYVELYCKIN